VAPRFPAARLVIAFLSYSSSSSSSSPFFFYYHCEIIIAESCRRIVSRRPRRPASTRAHAKCARLRALPSLSLSLSLFLSLSVLSPTSPTVYRVMTRARNWFDVGHYRRKFTAFVFYRSLSSRCLPAVAAYHRLCSARR